MPPVTAARAYAEHLLEHVRAHQDAPFDVLIIVRHRRNPGAMHVAGTCTADDRIRIAGEAVEQLADEHQARCESSPGKN